MNHLIQGEFMSYIMVRNFEQYFGSLNLSDPEPAPEPAAVKPLAKWRLVLAALTGQPARHRYLETNSSDFNTSCLNPTSPCKGQ
jgi:hypothetical protein